MFYILTKNYLWNAHEFYSILFYGFGKPVRNIDRKQVTTHIQNYVFSTMLLTYTHKTSCFYMTATQVYNSSREPNNSKAGSSSLFHSFH
jgi:hypothetical protein